MTWERALGRVEPVGELLEESRLEVLLVSTLSVEHEVGTSPDPMMPSDTEINRWRGRIGAVSVAAKLETKACWLRASRTGNKELRLQNCH
jgi:hypothetical protein